MIFTLEALQAKEGDCLLIHYGPDEPTGLMLIDGGPPGTFRRVLAPRLEELRPAVADAAVEIDLGMVSHIDADHIAGLLDLTRVLTEAKRDQRPPPYVLRRFWHNSLEAMIGDVSGPASLSRLASAASTSRPVPRATREDVSAVIASVPQGQRLADDLEFLLPANQAGVIASGHTLPLPDGPTLTVIGPDQEELAALREQWEREVPRDEDAEVAAYLDDSIPNLSSIVCLVEFEGKRILLTGDARGDHVLEGLERAGLLKGRRRTLSVDILKLPHHGSEHNVDQDFFDRIQARHYVISADGAHGNPEDETLTMLLASRPKDDKFTIWLTNRTGRKGLGPRLEAYLEAHPDRTWEMRFRDSDALSLRIDLGDPLTI
ncbi:ComEC/Rec2 family competence protein [Miltoncostaea oceani]|uniref:ComEC/Rec2 family competence protein n=1 Tax=Miltoncostaea oceani TaxID=2843216 RepID=UPI001C3C5F80|nr:MBL fold metallo-hydrolase [Miltoncostaea oceani]